jgi:hypothetical protein
MRWQNSSIRQQQITISQTPKLHKPQTHKPQSEQLHKPHNQMFKIHKPQNMDSQSWKIAPKGE